VNAPKWISSAIATAIHDEAIYEFGGLAGIRDAGLLESALDLPRNLLAYEPRVCIFRLAATLCVGIAKNHPFNDGNKRTALLATRAFLYLNGQGRFGLHGTCSIRALSASVRQNRPHCNVSDQNHERGPDLLLDF
jgi:death-on-curing protein